MTPQKSPYATTPLTPLETVPDGLPEGFVPFVFRAWCELTATLGRKNGGDWSYPR